MVRGFMECGWAAWLCLLIGSAGERCLTGRGLRGTLAPTIHAHELFVA